MAVQQNQLILTPNGAKIFRDTETLAKAFQTKTPLLGRIMGGLRGDVFRFDFEGQTFVLKEYLTDTVDGITESGLGQAGAYNLIKNVISEQQWIRGFTSEKGYKIQLKAPEIFAFSNAQLVMEKMGRIKEAKFLEPGEEREAFEELRDNLAGLGFEVISKAELWLESFDAGKKTASFVLLDP